MNKKGDYDLGSRSVTAVIKVLFVLVFVLFIGAILYQYRAQTMSSYPLEVEILTSQLLYKCIVDEPGVINLDKFNQDTIHNCINKEGMGFQVTLTNLNGNIIKDTVNLMPEYLKSVYPTCNLLKNKTCITKNQFISYKDKDQINQGILKIEVIFENA